MEPSPLFHAGGGGHGRNGSKGPVVRLSPMEEVSDCESEEVGLGRLEAEVLRREWEIMF